MTGIERKGLGSTSLYKAPSSTTTTTQATVLSGTTVRPWQNNRTNERNDLVSLAFSPDGRSIAYNLWTIRNTGFLVEEIRSVPASGGTPTVIVPEGSGSSILHQDLAWAPQLGAGLAVRRPEGRRSGGPGGRGSQHPPRPSWRRICDHQRAEAARAGLHGENSDQRVAPLRHEEQHPRSAGGNPDHRLPRRQHGRAVLVRPSAPGRRKGRSRAALPLCRYFCTSLHSQEPLPPYQ
jgi:hypothetical protein